MLLDYDGYIKDFHFTPAPAFLDLPTIRHPATIDSRIARKVSSPPP